MKQQYVGISDTCLRCCMPANSAYMASWVWRPGLEPCWAEVRVLCSSVNGASLDSIRPSNNLISVLEYGALLLRRISHWSILVSGPRFFFLAWKFSQTFAPRPVNRGSSTGSTVLPAGRSIRDQHARTGVARNDAVRQGPLRRCASAEEPECHTAGGRHSPRHRCVRRHARHRRACGQRWCHSDKSGHGTPSISATSLVRSIRPAVVPSARPSLPRFRPRGLPATQLWRHLPHVRSPGHSANLDHRASQRAFLISTDAQPCSCIRARGCILALG